MIKIAFTDFYPKFDKEDNFIVNVLRQKYEVIVVKEVSDEVDILFYSCFGFEHFVWPEEIIRVYYTGENDVPNFNEADYAISFHNINFGNRHLRLPLYVTYPNFPAVKYVKPLPVEACNREFCSLVVSNSTFCDPVRLQIIDKINEYKTVASGGRYRNNVGGPVVDKMEFCHRYKFNLALENSRVPGYVTEKITDAFAAGTVPIYWGTTDVCNDFNPDSYINTNDFETIEAALAYIRKVDEDDELYLKMLNAPKIAETSKYADWEKILLNFLMDIIEEKNRFVTQYGESGVMNKKQYLMQSFNSHLNMRRLFKKWNQIFPPNYGNW